MFFLLSRPALLYIFLGHTLTFGLSFKSEEETGATVKTKYKDFNGIHTYYNEFTCEDPYVKSFTAIQCSSPSACNKKLQCVTDQVGCSGLERIWYGKQCSGKKECLAFPLERRLNSDKSTNEYLDTELYVPTFFSIAICLTTDLRINKRYIFAGKFVSVQDKGESFYPYYQILIKTTRLDSSNTIHHHSTNEVLDVYENELLSINCFVSSFWFRKPLHPIQGINVDGTKFRIDPQLIVQNRNYSQVPWEFSLERFRVSKSMKGFSCGALWYNSSEVMKEEKILFRVIPLPKSSRISTKSTGGRTIFVEPNQSVSCTLVKRMYQQDYIRKTELNKQIQMYLVEFSPINIITSIISFLRLQNLFEKYGEYVCVVLPTRTVFQFSYEVRLNPPTSPKIDNSKEYGHDYDDDSIGPLTQAIYCKYKGEPEPHILWLRNGKMFHYSLGEWRDDHYESTLELPLLIDSAVDGYSNFTCIAVNHLGNDTRHYFVESKPLIDRNEENQHLSMGHSGILNLSCVYEGGPRTTIQWLQNGQKIQESFHSRDDHGRARYEKSIVQLNTNESGGRHEIIGNYSCFVNNSLGHDIIYFFVHFNENVEELYTDNTGSGGHTVIIILSIIMVAALLAVIELSIFIVKLLKKNELLEMSHKFIGGTCYEKMMLTVGQEESSIDDPAS